MGYGQFIMLRARGLRIAEVHTSIVLDKAKVEEGESLSWINDKPKKPFYNIPYVMTSSQLRHGLRQRR